MTEDRSIPPTARDLSPADDSGIIDLRALAARYAQSTALERESSPDLLVAPSWAPPAPAAIPMRRRSRWVGGALAASATLAISMVAFAAVPSLIARTVREPAPVAVAVAPAPAPAPIVTEEIEVPIAPVVIDEPAPRPAPADVPARPRRASVPSPARPAPARETATGTAPAQAIDSELDRLIDAALSGTRPSAAPAETLPATPSQRDVMSALRGLERQVAMCREGDQAIAATRLVIDGATGRVRSVRVSGVDATASACVSELVETATFPRFAQDTFTVTFPYRI